MHAQPLPYDVWGAEQIDPGAIAQMDAAMRLPVTVAGALMPDAHVGYGLPIGGVLATENAVIPYAVGVDIACRMRLSVYPQSPIVLGQEPKRFERALLDRTYFGAGVANPLKPEHEVLDAPAWRDTRLLHGLQNLAAKQLGTSGTGNHFVEWGSLSVVEYDPQPGSAAGRVPGAAVAQRVARRGLQDRQRCTRSSPCGLRPISTTRCATWRGSPSTRRPARSTGTPWSSPAASPRRTTW